VAYSIADQALAVGGGFLVNVALARTQTKEEYGKFVLSYSVLTFLLGLYYATFLDPFTVYGSGRYRARFSEYLRLTVRSNALLSLVLTGILVLICGILSWIAPHLISRALWGLALTAAILLSSYFLRRVFYVQRQPALAAVSSLVFFVTVACGLWLLARAHRLDSFTVFLSLALGWIAAGAAFGRRVRFGKPTQPFLALEPQYWRHHWNYSKWALATAFVFQFTTQGYYWLVGGFLSAKQVAELRAAYNLVAPADQVFIALSFVVLPALASHYAAKRMDKLLSLWKLYVFVNVGVTAFLFLGVGFLGKPVMHVLYAGKFDDLFPLLLRLALYPLVMGIAITIVQALSALEQPKRVFYAFICSGTATFLVGIPLVVYFGLQGAVYGMIFSGGTFTLALAVGFISSVKEQTRKQAAPTPLARSLSPRTAIPESPHARPVHHRDLGPELAPIAMFVYNRSEHTRQTVEALARNELAQRSDLFVFADGAKDQAAASAVRDVRRYIAGVEGFRSMTLIERERNLGLNNSIIAGVTRLCEEYGQAIVVEDDVVTAPDFLGFMNLALDRYKREPKVFSVGGFNIPNAAPTSYPYDALFSYLFQPWGWATWKNRWEKADWAVTDFKEFMADRERRKRFELAGNGHILTLVRQMRGKADGFWDTIWAYNHSKYDAVQLVPVISKTYNIGIGTGTHGWDMPFTQATLQPEDNCRYRFPETVEMEPHYVATIQRLGHKSWYRKVGRHIFDILGVRGSIRR